MAAVLSPAANMPAVQRKRGNCGGVVMDPLPARARAADTGIMQVNYTLNLSLPTGD